MFSPMYLPRLLHWILHLYNVSDVSASCTYVGEEGQYHKRERERERSGSTLLYDNTKHRMRERNNAQSFHYYMAYTYIHTINTCKVILTPDAYTYKHVRTCIQDHTHTYIQIHIHIYTHILAYKHMQLPLVHNKQNIAASISKCIIYKGFQSKTHNTHTSNHAHIYSYACKLLQVSYLIHLPLKTKEGRCPGARPRTLRIFWVQYKCMYKGIAYELLSCISSVCNVWLLALPLSCVRVEKLL